MTNANTKITITGAKKERHVNCEKCNETLFIGNLDKGNTMKRVGEKMAKHRCRFWRLALKVLTTPFMSLLMLIVFLNANDIYRMVGGLMGIILFIIFIVFGEILNNTLIRITKKPRGD